MNKKTGKSILLLGLIFILCVSFCSCGQEKREKKISGPTPIELFSKHNKMEPFKRNNYTNPDGTYVYKEQFDITSEDSDEYCKYLEEKGYSLIEEESQGENILYKYKDDETAFIWVYYDEANAGAFLYGQGVNFIRDDGTIATIDYILNPNSAFNTDDIIPHPNPDPNPNPYPYPDIYPNMFQTKTNCSVCGGTGRVTCVMCNGSGKLSFGNSAPDFGYGGSSYTTQSGCATCGGSGEMICNACGGSGGYYY